MIPGRQYRCNYHCKRKMLKETESKKTIDLFFVTFLSLVSFQLGAGSCHLGHANNKYAWLK